MVRYNIEDVTENMVLGETISLPSGKMLLNAGYNVTERYRSRLKEMGLKTLLIQEPGTEEVVPDTLISDAKVQEMGSQLDESEKELTSVLNKFKNDHLKTDVTKQIFENRKDLNKFIMNSTTAKQLEGIIEEIMGEPEIVLNLAAQNRNDSSFLRHSINVAITSLCLGRKHQFSYDEIKQLGIGALNYHMGLLALPDEIIRKKASLSEEEKKEFKKHTIYGYMMLSQTQHIPPTSAIVALQHHEQQNGKGYPLSLKGKNALPKKDLSQTHVIHRFAEIVSIADMYHRMLPDDAEPNAIHIKNALANLIKLSGEWLNKEIVKTLTTIVPIYPIGTRLRIVESPVPKLKQYIGVVSKDNPNDITKPVILLYQTLFKERVNPPIVIHPEKVPGLKFEVIT